MYHPPGRFPASAKHASGQAADHPRRARSRSADHSRRAAPTPETGGDAENAGAGRRVGVQLGLGLGDLGARLQHGQAQGGGVDADQVLACRDLVAEADVDDVTMPWLR